MARFHRSIGIVAAVLALAPVWAQTPPSPPSPPSSRSPHEPRSAGYAPAVPGGRSYLGVDIRDITNDRVAPLKLKEEAGVEVVMVDQDAPAGKAGLKEHDVVLTFNSTKVEGEEQLRRMLRETPPGRTVTLGISRDGRPMNVQVQLADRRKVMADAQDWNFNMPEMPVIPAIHIPEITIPSMDINVMGRSYSPAIGLMVEGLTPQLGEFFGVKDGEGVLVRSVEKGGAAEASGLRAGDIIVKFEGKKIADQADWRHALRAHKGGKVMLNVVRDKKDQVISLTLPEPKQSGNASTLEGPWDQDLSQVAMEFDRVGTEMEKSLHESELKMKADMERVHRQFIKSNGDVEKMMHDISNSFEDASED